MGNAKPLRALLTFVEDHPEQVDMTIYGETGRPCGPVADLAGHTLLLNDWELVADNTFRHRDSGRVICRWQDIEDEARAVLGLSDEEFWAGGDLDCLFTASEAEAVKRLRELAEQAEAAVANA